MTEKYTSFEVTKGKEQLVKDSTGKIYAGNWQQSQMDKDDNMITIGFHDDPMRGPRFPSKIDIPSLYQHILITGQTGYGKSVLINNIQKQLIDKGHGLTFIDPKGDSAKKLLNKIPEHRLDDVVWVRPGSEREKQVGFNIFDTSLNPSDPKYEREVNSIAGDFIQLIKNKSDTWGPQISNITETLVKQLIRSDDSFTPVDLVNIMTDKQKRESFAENYGDNLEKKFLKSIAEQDDEVFEPILHRIREWVSDRETRSILFNKNSKINISEIINDNKILLIDTSGIQSPSTKEIIMRLLIARIWSTIRMSNPDENPDPFFLYIDEFDKVINNNFDINSIIAQARSYNFGVCVSFRQMSQLPKTTKGAVRQLQTPISFYSGGHPSECASIAQLYDIAPQIIKELDRFEAISHVYSKNGYKSDEPMNVKMFAEYPPIRENTQQVIEKSINKYGCKIN